MLRKRIVDARPPTFTILITRFFLRKTWIKQLSYEQLILNLTHKQESDVNPKQPSADRDRQCRLYRILLEQKCIDIAIIHYIHQYACNFEIVASSSVFVTSSMSVSFGRN